MKQTNRVDIPDIAVINDYIVVVPVIIILEYLLFWKILGGKRQTSRDTERLPVHTR